MGIKVHFMDYGSNMADNSIFIAGESPGKRVKIPVMGAFIEHPDAKILIDTGVKNTKITAAVECQYAQNAEQNPTSQLKRFGLTPEDIDYVIITHLHWDHAGNIDLFKNAKIVVRREELKEAFVPATPGDMNYNRPDFDNIPNWMFLSNDVDYELVSGVTLLSVPGHTPGTQSVLVDTNEGKIIWASDSVYWHRNWEENKLPGIMSNGDQFLRSITKMKSFLNATLIPGHDPQNDLTRVFG
jgi:N-acyl homoserine lactone hydrolase